MTCVFFYLLKGMYVVYIFIRRGTAQADPTDRQHSIYKTVQEIVLSHHLHHLANDVVIKATIVTKNIFNILDVFLSNYHLGTYSIILSFFLKKKSFLFVFQLSIQY